MSAILKGTALAWNTGAVTDQEEITQEVTVTGAVLGDFVQVASSLDIVDLILTAQVTATDTVTASIGNQTTGTPDPGTIDITCLVYSRSGLT